MYDFNEFKVELLYGAIAVAGGVARYLNNFVAGQQFRFSIFAASSFVSGFSGYMFAVLGISLDLPQPVLFVMAGVGGFFGDQTMKFILEYFQTKIK